MRIGYPRQGIGRVFRKVYSGGDRFRGVVERGGRSAEARCQQNLHGIRRSDFTALFGGREIAHAQRVDFKERTHYLWVK